MAEFVKIPVSKQSLGNRRLVYGVGVNDAWYMIHNEGNGKDARCPAYRKWTNMLDRCYSKNLQERHPTYKDCTVCDEWLTFSTFAKWFEINNVKGYHLDKDLKAKGNKTYSPNACLFVPCCINTLLVDCEKSRGDYPAGVSFFKRDEKYVAQITIDRKNKYLGLFETPELASDTYVKAKNAEIKRKCEQYPQFAKYLINHMLSWD